MGNHEYYTYAATVDMQFYKMPQALYLNQEYRPLSISAKVLYSILYDQMGLSVENGWSDEQGRIFILYTYERAEDFFGWGKDKVAKTFNELIAAGLIERYRLGKNKPYRIYVKRLHQVDYKAKKSIRDEVENEYNTWFSPQVGKTDVPQVGKTDVPQVGKTDVNNTKIDKDYIYVYNSSNHQNYIGPDEMDEIEEEIENQIEIDALKNDYPDQVDLIENIKDIMLDLETIDDSSKVIIGGQAIKGSKIKKKLSKIDMFVAQYIIDSISKTKTEIRNVRAYLVAVIYNAPDTFAAYNQLKYQHDTEEYYLSRAREGDDG